MPFFVYILESTSNRHYIGYTSNLEQRVYQHNRKHKGYTHSKTEDWYVIAQREFADKKSAMEYERYLKSLKNYNAAKVHIEKTSGSEHPDAIGRVRGSNP